MKTLINSIIYCQTVSLERLLIYVCCENFMSDLSASDQWLMEIVCSAQHQSSLVGDYSLVYMNLEWYQLLSCLNATYYAQHPALKSVYGKSQSAIDGKLISSYRTGFELVHTWSLRFQNKWLGLLPYEAHVQKEALTICQDRLFASFYVLYHYYQF